MTEIEREEEPSHFADLQHSPAELRVPLGSSEIARRRLKSVLLGRPWAPERMANSADF